MVVGRKTLVAAGHVTTQNLVGKKSVGSEGWQSILFVDVTTFWVSNHDHLAVTKSYSFYRGSKSNLPMKDATRFLPFLKYRRLSFTKKFGSRMEQKLFDG